MKATLKIALVLVGLIALSLVEVSLMFWNGMRDIQGFCSEAKPGIQVSQIAVLAKKYNVRQGLPGLRANSATHWVLVSTPRSFGRHTCLVQFDKTQVIESRYGYAD